MAMEALGGEAGRRIIRGPRLARIRCPAAMIAV
jgi:hypothetical protein